MSSCSSLISLNYEDTFERARGGSVKTKTRKQTLALFLSAAAFFSATWAISLRCSGSFTNLRIDSISSALPIIGLPIFEIFLLYGIFYDLISLLTYKAGYESTYDEIPMYPGEHPPAGTPKLSLRGKLLFGYPLFLVVWAVFAYVWADGFLCK
jgi:hypothetical protein